MAKHTPGPWHVPTVHSDFQVHGPDDLRVADTMTLQRHAAECEANSRLIAAAPDLLASVRDLLLQHKDTCAIDLRGGVCIITRETQEAIAKAEGR